MYEYCSEKFLSPSSGCGSNYTVNVLMKGSHILVIIDASSSLLFTCYILLVFLEISLC